MEINHTEKENGYTLSKSLRYSFAQVADIIGYQSFTFLIFTFYFTIVRINIILISTAFIIWSVWNSVNDPLLGTLSDRTNTKYGRRFPYIALALIPYALVTMLLFIPPVTFGITEEILNFVYFFAIILIFELFYTMFSLNQVSLFPEIFSDIKARAKANNVRQTIAILALIIAFVLPTLFIPDLSNSEYLINYQIFGLMLSILICVFGVLFLKFSPREKSEFRDDYKKAPLFFQSIKTCLKSKSFRWYIPTEVCTWFVYGTLPTIIPLYAKFVLGVGEGESILIALMLGIAFISAAIFTNVLWKPVIQRIGPRKAWMLSMIIWILTMIPLLFISDVISGFIVFALMGIGLAGSLMVIDIIIGQIVDEDEVDTGSRREASYYGVNALLLRLSTVLVFLAIGPVFIIGDWQVYDPNNITSEIIFGLRALIAIFPIIALTIGILTMYKYPLDGEKLKAVNEELEQLHISKKTKTE